MVILEASDGLKALTRAVIDVGRIQQEQGPARERLEALELSRAQWEAEMQGLVLKAEGQYRAAFNAEARERTIKKSNERNADSFSETGDQPETPEDVTVLSDDVAPSEEERLQSMRLVLEANPKAIAVNHKWGRG